MLKRSHPAKHGLDIDASGGLDMRAQSAQSLPGQSTRTLHGIASKCPREPVRERFSAVHSENWTGRTPLFPSLKQADSIPAGVNRAEEEGNVMGYNNIIYETDDRLAFVTLNRPEKLNALSHALRGEVYDAMREAEADPAIGVIILKGAGRAFSAGYDLTPNPNEQSDYVSDRSGMPDTGSTHPQHYDWSRHALMGHWLIWELAKPVIAQVHGWCLAGATELASMCDMRMVADDARVGYPPVRAQGTMDMMWAALVHEARQGPGLRLYRRLVQRRRNGRTSAGRPTPSRRTNWKSSPSGSRAASATSTTTS